MTSFDHLETVPENWIEAPNFRRGGTSGVIKTRIDNNDVYIKKQNGHIYRSFRHPCGQPTALREQEAILAMQKLGVRVPDILHCESRRINGRLRTYLVTRALEGYEPLDSFFLHRYQALPADKQQQLIKELAEMLAKIHRCKWQHTALYPKHIFIRTEGEHFEFALIDLEKMRRRLTVKQASKHDLEQFSRHQPAWGEKGWATFLASYEQALAAN